VSGREEEAKKNGSGKLFMEESKVKTVEECRIKEM
jgi:hypothetical protein